MFSDLLKIGIGIILFLPFQSINSQHYQHFDEEMTINRHKGYRGRYRKELDNDFWLHHYYTEKNHVKVTPRVFKKVCNSQNIGKPHINNGGDIDMRLRCKYYSKNISLERLIDETSITIHEARDFDYVVGKFCEKVMDEYYRPRQYYRRDWILRCMDKTLDNFVKYARFGFNDSSTHKGSMWESMKNNLPATSLELP